MLEGLTPLDQIGAMDDILTNFRRVAETVVTKTVNAHLQRVRDMPPEAYKVAMAKLNGMYSYCTGGECRHKAILRYFGQTLDKDNCTACDMCLGEMDSMDNSLETAQKILSCVVRIEQRFVFLFGFFDHRLFHFFSPKLNIQFPAGNPGLFMRQPAHRPGELDLPFIIPHPHDQVVFFTV